MSSKSDFLMIDPRLFRPSEEKTWGENAHQKHTPGDNVCKTDCVKEETSSEGKSRAHTQIHTGI